MILPAGLEPDPAWTSNPATLVLKADLAVLKAKIAQAEQTIARFSDGTHPIEEVDGHDAKYWWDQWTGAEATNAILHEEMERLRAETMGDAYVGLVQWRAAAQQAEQRVAGLEAHLRHALYRHHGAIPCSACDAAFAALPPPPPAPGDP